MPFAATRRAPIASLGFSFTAHEKSPTKQAGLFLYWPFYLVCEGAAGAGAGTAGAGAVRV
jgi:hypothetical protein